MVATSFTTKWDKINKSLSCYIRIHAQLVGMTTSWDHHKTFHNDYHKTFHNDSPMIHLLSLLVKDG